MARIAKSLDTLRSQINAAYPGRKTGSDGWIGNEAHRRTTSEHNPDSNGVVRALDITNDPKHGVYARQIAEAIVRSRDPRVLYIISNGQIVRSYARSGTTPWKWSAYGGSNPHIEHFHTSVVEKKQLYDSVALWSLPKLPAPIEDVTVNRNITATMFSDTRLAYQDVKPGHLDRFGVALPYSFPSPRPKVRLWRAGEPDTAVIADIIDKGPWHINDPYWLAKNGRPDAENGVISFGQNQGKKSNGAGIDVTPALNKKLMLNGKGRIDWEFVK